VRYPCRYYGGKYQHVREVREALQGLKQEDPRFNVPVLADDLMLYPYQVRVCLTRRWQGLRTFWVHGSSVRTGTP
jgi:hypothetical protein